MKANVIATGEIINVEFSHKNMSDTYFYRNIRTNDLFKQEELMFMDGTDTTQKNIDWEQRRFELVKSAMQGFIASDIDDKYPADSVAKWCIEYADAVIAKLKEERL